MRVLLTEPGKSRDIRKLYSQVIAKKGLIAVAGLAAKQHPLR